MEYPATEPYGARAPQERKAGKRLNACEQAFVRVNKLASLLSMNSVYIGNLFGQQEIFSRLVVLYFAIIYARNRLRLRNLIPTQTTSTATSFLVSSFLLVPKRQYIN